MIASEAREVLQDVASKTTGYDATKALSIIHGDGSVFFFSCCWYELRENWIFIIPEHAEPQMFSIAYGGEAGDCSWVDVTDL